MHILASQIVAGARQLRGVVWRHRGRDKNGVDCIGLVLFALRAAGWTPKNSEAVSRLDYDRLSTRDELLEVLRGEGEEIEAKPGVLRAGDIVVFRFPNHAWTQHLGLISEVRDGVPILIHARATGKRETSRVVEHDLADGWLEALDCAFRIEGVTLDG